MSWAPIIMYAVAGVLILAGIVAIVAIRGQSDGAVYARRILVTMLLTLGGILAFFAWSMARWETGA
jgi:predicted small integral membrane protein